MPLHSWDELGISEYEQREILGAKFKLDLVKSSHSFDDNETIVLVAVVYCGMGHYCAVARMTEPKLPDSDGKRYFILHMGGSNGYEREEHQKCYDAIKAPQEPLYTIAELREKTSKYQYAEDFLGLLQDMQSTQN
jgi:hypothetical protein